MNVTEGTPRQSAFRRRIALVTGASSGIGRVYACRLAERQYDLVLVARREDRLLELKRELEARHGTRSEVLVADLADPAGIEKVASRIGQLPELEFLVNNAGFGTADNFAAVGPELHQAMIHVHVLAPMRLCRAALPGMIARGRGVVVNVSSLAALIPCPGGANYAATKAYLNSLSESLQLELAGTGVRVQALCPGFTRTGFHDVEAFHDFDRARIPIWLSSEQVVDASLRALETRKVICVPGLMYKLLARLFGWRLGRRLAGNLIGKEQRRTEK